MTMPTLPEARPDDRTRQLTTNIVAGHLQTMVSMIPEDQDEALEVISKMHRIFAKKMVRRIRNSLYAARSFNLPQTYFKSGEGRAILMEALPVGDQLAFLDDQLDNAMGFYDANDHWIEADTDELIEQQIAARKTMAELAEKIMKEGFK